MKNTLYNINWVKATFFIFIALNTVLKAQTGPTIHLKDLDSFKNPGKSWHMASKVWASLDKDKYLETNLGNGILVNIPNNRYRGSNLFTKSVFGDIDLELDFMMAKESNSGIYLQGLYEIQLRDSWTVKDPTFADNGGIYQRRDETRPEGMKGYQGHSPRQNASRAPGLWQHLKVSFRAPRFDENGKKIENARILRAELNGVAIHENVILYGPTGAMANGGEVTEGPLMIQGNHGAVAFRNIQITKYETPAPVLKNLRYEIFEGEFEKLPDFDTLSVQSSGMSELLTANLPGIPTKFLLRYNGTLVTPKAGDYQFELDVDGGRSGGYGQLKINNEIIIPFQREKILHPIYAPVGEILPFKGSVLSNMNLPKGEVPIEVLYSKTGHRIEPAIGLSVSAPDIRKQPLSIDLPQPRNLKNPVFIEPENQTMVRTFRDLQVGTRLTHIISVGSSDNIHYSYDLNRGNIVQVWRGKFLDLTAMWQGRGDGSSEPSGSVINLLTDPAMLFDTNVNERNSWHADTIGSSFQSKGYQLNKDNDPTFIFKVFGTKVRDKIQVKDRGIGLQRTVELMDIPSKELYCRLAVSTNILKVDGSNNRYLIGDHEYYIQIDGTDTSSPPIIRSVDNKKELLLPIKNSITYSIVF